MTPLKRPPAAGQGNKLGYLNSFSCCDIIHFYTFLKDYLHTAQALEIENNGEQKSLMKNALCFIGKGNHRWNGYAAQVFCGFTVLHSTH